MENSLHGEFILNGDSPEPETTERTQPEEKNLIKKTPLENNLHFYSSFMKSPQGIVFSEQEANEKIVLLFKKHFATNIPWILSTSILIFLPLLSPFIIRNFPFPLPSQHILSLYFALYYLVIFGFCLINFTLWYFQVGIITNLRVIDISLSGILYRQISETKLEHVEDVSHRQAGFIRSLFRYGNVLIQTAGTQDNIEYENVPYPEKISEVIENLS